MDRMTPVFKIVPNLFIIGAPRCGTTSLHYYLKEHPDVHATDYKDYHFFEYPEKLPSLSRIFIKNYHNQKIILDTGAGYFYDANNIEKILRVSPDAKFILCLRDPVERTISEYNFNFKKGKKGISFARLLGVKLERQIEAMKEEIMKSHYSYYFKNLQMIPEKQLIILPFEELYGAQQDRCFQKLNEFLQLQTKPDLVIRHFNKGIQSGKEGDRMPGTGRIFYWKAVLSITSWRHLFQALLNQREIKKRKINTANDPEKYVLLKRKLACLLGDELNEASNFSGIDFRLFWKTLNTIAQ